MLFPAYAEPAKAVQPGGLRREGLFILLAVTLARFLQHVHVLLLRGFHVVYRKVDEVRVRDVIKVVLRRLPVGIPARRTSEAYRFEKFAIGYLPS